ncbi:uncharacterized protein LOC129315990 [Prosopis cineraria]|uniref:uncharacterized protein LOC129298498 n=1 Tax=Prosopis cineraria TaxID=364024 RepID=UPI0024104CE3|nr:uncharacterized protein LOC129298498 [Prosopis cineraria]XP_054816179.1 uncharacterized protein LOC129315990 [Prosopis cineraria]
MLIFQEEGDDEKKEDEDEEEHKQKEGNLLTDVFEWHRIPYHNLIVTFDDTSLDRNWPRFHPRNAKIACKDKEATRFVLESNAVKPLASSILDFLDTRRTEDVYIPRCLIIKE